MMLPVFLALLWLAGPAAASPDCSAVTAAYVSKGLDVMQVNRLLSGAHLSICQQRATCCSRAMEDNLVLTARSELRRRVLELTSPRAARLDSLLLDLQRLQLEFVEASRRELDHNLKSIYGYSYLANKAPFTAFFDRLAAFVRGDAASGPVAGVASDLFDAIAGRVYALTMSNYNLDRRYLDCAKRQFSALRPLGAMPDRVGAELLKGFVTGRRFQLGLAGLAEALRGAGTGAGLQLSADCQRARMRAHYCSWCDGVASAPPCYNLCANVAAGCLAGLSPLAAPFDQLLAELERMTGLVDGASGMHMALRQLGFRISSGIMEMQERKDQLHARIASACGSPSLKTGASVGASGVAMMPSSSGAASADSGTGEAPADLSSRLARLTQLVGRVRTELRSLRGFFNWELLVQKDCQLEPRPDACWNGTAVASYQRVRRGSSGPDLTANPEVSVRESSLTHPAEPVASRRSELQTAIELATSLPRGGESYREYLEATGRERLLTRLLPMQRPGLASGLPALAPPSAGAARSIIGGSSGSGAAPPPSWSATGGRRTPPPPPQPVTTLLLLSTLAPTPPRTPPPPPPSRPTWPPVAEPGSGDRPPSPGPVGSGDWGPPPAPVLPDPGRTTERIWLPRETSTALPTTMPTTSTTTTSTTTSTTTTTTTTPTTTSTTTTPTTTSATTTRPTAAPSTTARSDTGGSGLGQPDQEPDDRLGTTDWPPLLPQSTHQPPGPAGSGDESPPPLPVWPWPPRPTPDTGGLPSGGEQPPNPPVGPPELPERPPQLPEFPSWTQRPPQPPPQWPTRRPPLPPGPPQRPQHPDLWLPKEPDEQGGAEGRRGEGSMHGPMRMTGSRRGLAAAAGRCLPMAPLTVTLAAAVLAWGLSGSAVRLA